MFKLTFLGTSSGMPTRERNVSAIAIEYTASIHPKRHGWLLVDCGEGTQHQLLKSHLSIHDLSAILITHTHGDHCYGLGGLLSSMNMHRRTKPLTLIAPKAIGQLLEVLGLVSQWHLNYPIHLLAIEDHLGSDMVFPVGDGHDISIRIHELSHRIASYGFEITQTLEQDKLCIEKLTNDGIAHEYWRAILKEDLKTDDALMIDGKRIVPQAYKTHTQKCLKIVVAGDNDTPELLSRAVRGCHALIHEATYTEDVRQKIIAKPAEQGGFDPKHSSVKMVAQFAQAHGVPKLILTHFSARYASFEDERAKQPNMGHIRAEARRYYEGKLILAEDFLQVMIEDGSSC